MSTKLFVGNLPYNLTDDSLNNTFAQAGSVVSAKVILDKVSGRSRGFGFVEMSTEEEAQKAISTLNGTEIDGRKIFVNEARPQTERSDRRDSY